MFFQTKPDNNGGEEQGDAIALKNIM